MHLEGVIAALAPRDVLRRADAEVAELAYDARDVRPGSLFFCVPGTRADGHGFAAEAVANGAVALVVERPLELAVPQFLVSDARRAMAVVADAFFERPTEELQVGGVTGTNGKTTTAFLLYSVLAAAGRRPGLLGTIESRVGGERRPAIRTTPEAIDLQRTFREMLDAGDRSCAMEATSHGSELGRLDQVRFGVLVFTNLTQDHLDFHGTMERYFEAKRRLFVESRPPAVINVGDPWGRRLAQDCPDALTFGFAEDAEVGEDAIVRGLEAVRGVPGRFESVAEGQSFAVIVDYSHKPDALESVLRTARELTAGRVICVFGCGGDRDRGKRPLMGRIASQLADVAILTSDNPRSEDPLAIIGEVLAGVDDEIEVEPDRAAAIERAIGEARDGDVVLIAGKGHEQGQEFADHTIPFDDREVARDALRRLGATA